VPSSLFLASNTHKKAPLPHVEFDLMDCWHRCCIQPIEPEGQPFPKASKTRRDSRKQGRGLAWGEGAQAHAKAREACFPLHFPLFVLQYAASPGLLGKHPSSPPPLRQYLTNPPLRLSNEMSDSSLKAPLP